MYLNHVLFSALVILFLSVASVAFAEVTVSNVSAVQQPGTKQVSISYDVNSTDTSTVNVSVSISDNHDPVPCASLRGDFGRGVKTGTSKSIIWDAGVDWNNKQSSNLRVEIIADDRFVLVEAGTDAGGHVLINEPFYINKHEVTNVQMAEVMQWAYDQFPSKIRILDSSVINIHGDIQQLLDMNASLSQINFSEGSFSVDPGMDNYPCVGVTWFGAAAYCNYLSEQEGLTPAYDLSDWSLVADANGYRLPNGTQWEYAARGGKDGRDTEFSGSNNIDEVAWYWENSDQAGNSNLYSGHGTLPVGEKAHNELGLNDMSGNVWEWCQNWHPESDTPGRVMRGGSWIHEEVFSHVLGRSDNAPNFRASVLGFRPILPGQRSSLKQ